MCLNIEVLPPASKFNISFTKNNILSKKVTLIVNVKGLSNGTKCKH